MFLLQTVYIIKGCGQGGVYNMRVWSGWGIQYEGVVRVGYTIKGCGQGGVYNKGWGIQ